MLIRLRTVFIQYERLISSKSSCAIPLLIRIHCVDGSSMDPDQLDLHCFQVLKKLCTHCAYMIQYGSRCSLAL